MSHIAPATPPKPRLSAKLRQAIELRVRGGKQIKEACQEAGLSQSGWHKAMQRPAVQEHLQAVQERFVTELEARRTAYKAEALEAARHLMMTAKSEAVRARMIEFLAGDGKAPQVAVNIDARQQSPKTYDFARPGQEVVTIIDADGSQKH